MALHQRNGETNQVDRSIERISAGTIVHDHYGTASISASKVTGVVDDSDSNINYVLVNGFGSTLADFHGNETSAENYGNTTTIIGGDPDVGTGSPGSAIQYTFHGTTIGVLGGTSPFAGKMRIYIDGKPAPGRVQASSLLAPPLSGGLATPAVLEGDTTIRCLNGALTFPVPGTVLIGDELISYTGILGTSLTGCTRGVNGTVPAKHYVNETVYQWASGISLYEPYGFSSKILIYYNPLLQPGQHTILVVADTDPTSGFARVPFDGFVVGSLLGAGNIFNQLSQVTFVNVVPDSTGFAHLGNLVPNNQDTAFLSVAGYTVKECEVPTSLKMPILGMRNMSSGQPDFYIQNGTPGANYTIVLTLAYLGQSI